MKNEEKENAGIVVELPLSEAGRDSILPRSSGDYASWLFSILMPLDLLYTYAFRYNRLAYHDMPNANSIDPISPADDNGPVMNYVSHHTWLGAAVTLSFLSISALSFFWEVKRQEKARNAHSPKYIYQQLKTVMSEQKLQEAHQSYEYKETADNLSPAQARDYAIDYNESLEDYVQMMFEADRHLVKKYQYIKLEDDKLQVTLKPGNLGKLESDGKASVEQGHHGIDITTHQDVGMSEEPGDELNDEDAESKAESKAEARPEVAATVAVPVQPKTRLQALGEAFGKYSQALINKVIHPAYMTTILMSFVFWIEWIGFDVFNGGVFDPFSVNGVANSISFGLPVVIGLAYPAYKIYNYFVNKPDKQPTLNEKAKIEEDMSTLLRRAIARREYVINRKYLVNEIGRCNALIDKQAKKGSPVNSLDHSKTNGHVKTTEAKPAAPAPQMDKQIKQLRDSNHVWLKPVVAFFSVSVGSFVALQYCTWILAGLSHAILGAFASTALMAYAGLPIIIGALTYGAYSAGATYLKVLAHNKTVDKTDHAAELNDLELRLAAHREKLGGKSNELYFKKAPVSHLETQFFQDPTRHGKSAYTDWNKFGARLFKLIDGGCTGIFLGRALLIKGQAIALPFTAAALSFPVTVALLVLFGGIFGALKVWEYHSQRKDAHVSNMIETRTERLECLRREVELLDLNETLIAKKVEVQNLPSVEPATSAYRNGSLLPTHQEEVTVEISPMHLNGMKGNGTNGNGMNGTYATNGTNGINGHHGTVHSFHSTKSDKQVEPLEEEKGERFDLDNFPPLGAVRA